MDKVSEATTPLSQQAVLEFLKRNREFTVGLLAGALTDQVVGDLWQYLKKKTGMDLLVPPISDLGSISQHYKQHHDYVSLAKLVPFIRLGMPREEVENLLGPPSEYYEERSMAFYLSDRWIDDLGRVTFIMSYKHLGGAHIGLRRPDSERVIEDIIKSARYTGRVESFEFCPWIRIIEPINGIWVSWMSDKSSRT